MKLIVQYKIYRYEHVKKKSITSYNNDSRKENVKDK